MRSVELKAPTQKAEARAVSQAVLAGNAYPVLPAGERQKAHIRPLRAEYEHLRCGAKTTVHRAIAETFATNPKFYGETFCAGCQKSRPVSEFRWTADNERVGS